MSFYSWFQDTESFALKKRCQNKIRLKQLKTVEKGAYLTVEQVSNLAKRCELVKLRKKTASTNTLEEKLNNQTLQNMFSEKHTK